MRKVVLWMSVSLDGYFEGPAHDLSWQRVDDELHQHFNDVLRPASAFLDGRVTWELMADYWPTADQLPGASAPTVEFAGIWREKPKIVWSRTITRADWNTTVRQEVDPAEIRYLTSGPGGDLVLGGADLAATFFAHGLVDELRLYVHPVLLGAGRPLFTGESAGLGLVETRSFGNGVVLLRYDVPHA
ncbi:MAG: dihydrofolate reductase family protein [Nocardioides sp.]